MHLAAKIRMLNLESKLGAANLKSQSLILVAGVATGALMMSLANWHHDVPTEAPSTVATPERAIEQTDPSSVAPPVTEAVLAARQPDLAEMNSPEPSAVMPNEMPAVYRDMIGPARPRSLSFSEVHALFEEEPREEAWANAMESGINDYVAMHAADRGLVIEYVECRSRYCEVGGYAIEGYEADSSLLWGDMTREDWWQGGSTYQSQGSGPSDYPGANVDEPDRFLGIIDRYEREY